MTLVSRWGYYQAGPHETLSDCEDCGNRYSNEAGWCSCGGSLHVVQSETSTGRSLRSVPYTIESLGPPPTPIVMLAGIEVPEEEIINTPLARLLKELEGYLKTKLYLCLGGESSVRRELSKAKAKIKKIKAKAGR